MKMGALLSGGRDWQTQTSRNLRIVDAFVIVWAVAGAYVIRFGIEPASGSGQDASYAWLSVALATTWWFMLGAWNSRQSRILGAGPDEYKSRCGVALAVRISGHIFVRISRRHGPGICGHCAASRPSWPAGGPLATPTASQRPSSRRSQHVPPNALRRPECCSPFGDFVGYREACRIPSCGCLHSGFT
ncbi:sugar transferase [Arthrobacter sp. Hiyo6]|nr:sugar transferase [Arthrobacter sp. Hiyo6]